MTRRKALGDEIMGDISGWKVNYSRLWQVIDELLSEVEANVLHLLYDQDGEPVSTYAAVGTYLGTTRQKVWHIKHNAIVHLTHPPAHYRKLMQVLVRTDSS